MNNAEYCKLNNWAVGTKLVGDEGYGPEVIEITAIGESKILAKRILGRKLKPLVCIEEGVWTLEYRDWVKYE